MEHETWNIKSKKKLGQNFLTNTKILEKIVEAGEVSPEDTILEIGPGKGSLTDILSQKAKKVIAVEKDPELVEWLKENKVWKNVEVVEGDILKNASRFMLHVSRFKVVANIPYYITSRLLRNLLEEKKRPSLILLMVQYEVARRLAAGPGEMNLLALSVQAYGKVAFMGKVSKNYFRPRPKVDSGLIKISDISDKWFQKNRLSPEKFFKIAKKAFGQKRKMIRHSLKGLPVPEKYQKLRPEALTPEDFAILTKFQEEKA